MPPLLAYHMVGHRLAHSWYGLDRRLPGVVLSMWVLNPVAGLRQTAVVLLAWTHACIGLHFWLRLRPWYPRAAPGLRLAAVLLPLLALLGFAQAGRYVAQRCGDPGWIEQTLADARPPRGEARGHPGIGALGHHRHVSRGSRRRAGGAGGAPPLPAALGAMRDHLPRRPRGDRCRAGSPCSRRAAWPRHPPRVGVRRPRALLDLPRARRAAPAALPPPSPEEQRVLARVGAPPGVRLACQLRPAGDLAVAPLLPASSGGARQRASAGRRLEGEEREIAMFFADLRGFTKLAEHKLPYDVVFILNRYFETVGGAIKRAGGVVNQFTGDGVMALFGLESGAGGGQPPGPGRGGARSCRSLAELSRQLAGEIASPCAWASASTPARPWSARWATRKGST